MGFWSGLGKVLQGKPIFETPPSNDQHGSGTTQPEMSTVSASSGSKNIPTVIVERSEYHNNGPHIRVSVHIKNHSSAAIELDKMRLLGSSAELDTHLRPGESREFTVYQGNRPNNRNYDDAYLVYKDETGDYFETHHTVDFQQENDNTYSPVRFRYVGQVKDI